MKIAIFISKWCFYNYNFKILRKKCPATLFLRWKLPRECAPVDKVRCSMKEDAASSPAWPQPIVPSGSGSTAHGLLLTDATSAAGLSPMRRFEVPDWVTVGVPCSDCTTDWSFINMLDPYGFHWRLILCLTYIFQSHLKPLIVSLESLQKFHFHDYIEINNVCSNI